MEKKTFLGIDVTPREKLWLALEVSEEAKADAEKKLEEVKEANVAYAHSLKKIKEKDDALAVVNNELHEKLAKMDELYKKKCEECAFEEQERVMLAEERNSWRQKYYDLLKDTPARGEGGRFVKRDDKGRKHKAFKKPYKRSENKAVEMSAECPSTPEESFFGDEVTQQ